MSHESFLDLLFKYSVLEERADRDALEQEIWTRFGVERTVLVLDMSGFTRLTAKHGVIHYLAMIRRMQLTAQPIVESFQGKIVKFQADNVYAVFAEPLLAVNACISMIHAFRSTNMLTVDDQDIFISCGIDHGRILLIEDRDFFGSAVNHASKLGEDLARKDEILVTGSAWSLIPRAAGLQGRHEQIEVAGVSLKLIRVIV